MPYGLIMNKAKQAIARSVSHNEIVYLDFSRTIERDLLAECDDHTICYRDHCDVHEFWGTDDDGNSWRAHLEDK